MTTRRAPTTGERLAVVETELKHTRGEVAQLRDDMTRAAAKADAERKAMQESIDELKALLTAAKTGARVLIVVGSAVGTIIGGIVATAGLIAKFSGWFALR